MRHARAQGNTYAAAAYIGVKETLHQTHPVSLEAHVLNQQHLDLYDQHVELDFNAFIRENIKFENREALQAQIACDLDAIHHALAKMCDEVTPYACILSGIRRNNPPYNLIIRPSGQ